MYSLALKIIKKYQEEKRIILLSESITGGGIAQALISVPNASQVLWASLVVYQAQAKHSILNIDSHLLTPQTIVSKDTVEAMAKAASHLYFKGIQDRKYVRFSSLAISGFADKQNAGLVYCSIETEQGIRTYHWQLKGNRTAIQKKSVNLSLKHLLYIDQNRNKL